MNKHNLKIAILTWLAFFNAPLAFASNPIVNANNQAAINLGYVPTQINNSPIINNSQYLKGHQLELGVSITKMFYERLYTQVALNAAAGNLSYGLNTFKTTATSLTQKGDIRIGYLFLPQERVGLTPYALIGYQYWQLDTGGQYENALIKNGYTEFLQNGFYGIGLLSQFTVNPRLVLSTDLTFGKTINPWLRYNAPELDNSLIGKNVIYQSAFMAPQPFYQVTESIDYALSPKVHAHAGVQYSHSQFSSSNTHPSQVVQPHLSVAEWHYQAGLGLMLDAPNDETSILYDAPTGPIVNANNLASLSAGYLLQNYAETIPGLDYYFDREVGNVPMVNLALNKTIDNVYAKFNLAFAGGNTAYKSTTGETNASSPPSNASTRNTFLDTGLRLGYMFFPKESFGLTPYVAGGYRRWLRDIAGVGDEGYLVNGYPETYQFSWYALGLLLQYSPHPQWVLSVDGNAGTMENVTNKSWTSFDAPRTFQKLLTLKQRFIYNIGVGGDYQFARDWHLLEQANYCYFHYGRSANSVLPHDGYWYEPNSTTRQLTVLVGVGYAFL